VLRPAVLTIATLTLIAGACSRQTRPKSQTYEGKSASGDPEIEVSSADDASASDDPCSQMFFERTYNLDYKKEIEQKIRATLEEESVYRFVYGKSLGPG